IDFQDDALQHAHQVVVGAVIGRQRNDRIGQVSLPLGYPKCRQGAESRGTPLFRRYPTPPPESRTPAPTAAQLPMPIPNAFCLQTPTLATTTPCLRSSLAHRTISNWCVARILRCGLLCPAGIFAWHFTVQEPGRGEPSNEIGRRGWRAVGR